MLLDVRLYQLRAGRRDEFHLLVRDETVPLARRYGHVVVDFGPSSHDDETYYLIRAFPSDQNVAKRSKISTGARSGCGNTTSG